MSLEQCEERVRTGDPERWRLLRGCAPEVQARLLPLYALNVEISSAAWVSQEPLVCEMRLQWWADAIEAMASGGPARGHPVLEACAPFLQGAAQRGTELLSLIEARRWDIWSEPFDDEAALFAHLSATGGMVMQIAAGLLQPDTSMASVMNTYGQVTGLAGWLQAAPLLEAQGRYPLPDGRPQGIARLADLGLQLYEERVARQRPQIGPALLPLLYGAREALALLRLAKAEPGRVAAGQLHLPEYKRRGWLAWSALTGRW